MSGTAFSFPDIVVVCEQHQTPYRAQTYKQKLDVPPYWVPTRKSGTRMTPLLKNSAAEFRQWFGSDESAPGELRQHSEIVCGASRCRNRVPVGDDSLGEVFGLIVASLKACEVAEKGGAAAGPRPAAFAATVAATSADSVTMTMEGLRIALRLAKFGDTP